MTPFLRDVRYATRSTLRQSEAVVGQDAPADSADSNPILTPPRGLCALFIFALLTLSSPGPAQPPAADWPRWLGPHGDGVAVSTGVLRRGASVGLRERWRRPIGDGLKRLLKNQQQSSLIVDIDPADFAPLLAEVGHHRFDIGLLGFLQSHVLAHFSHDPLVVFIGRQILQHLSGFILDAHEAQSRDIVG